MLSAVSKPFRQWAWFFPILILGVGFCFSPLREPVQAAIPSNKILGGILAQVILAFAWILAEYRFAASRDTEVSQLQLDARLSLLLSLGFCLVGGYLFALGALPWYALVPGFAAVVDAFTTANQAINNAAQKPLMHVR